jgi:hypothetical protein
MNISGTQQRTMLLNKEIIPNYEPLEDNGIDEDNINDTDTFAEYRNYIKHLNII